MIEKVDFISNHRMQLHRYDGTVIWVQDSANAVRDSSGHTMYYYGRLEDITERVQAEEELRISKRFSEEIAYTAPSFIYVIDISNQKYLYANDAYEKVLGFPKERVLADDGYTFMLSRIHPDDRTQVLESQDSIIERLNSQPGELEHNEVFEFEYRVKDANNNWRWIYSWDVVFETNEDSEVSQILGVSHDITEQKRAEERLKESERKLSEAQKVANLGHYVFDIKIGSWTNSDELDDIFGIGENYKRDLNGWLQIVHPDYKETMSIYLQDNVLTQHQEFDKEYSIVNIRTGQEKWVHGLGKLKFDDNGDPVEMFGIIQDITERKQAETSLHKHALEQNILLKVSQSVSSTLDLETVLQTISIGAAQLLDVETTAIYILEGEELFLRATTPSLDPQMPESLRWAQLSDHPHILEAVSTRLPITLPDTRLAKLSPAEKDVVELRQLRSLIYLPFQHEENVVGVLILGTISQPREFSDHEIDLCLTITNQLALGIQNARLHTGLKKYTHELETQITERRQAEKALRESEELHRLTLNSISDAVFITDATGAFTFICPNVNTIFGYSLSEVEEFGHIVGLLGDDLFDPDDLETWGEISNIEREILDKAGREHALLVSVKRISIKGGTILYTCRDITERKQADEQLKQALAEKTTLLQELYHRTKNNMQVIHSLLALRSMYLQDEQLLGVLDDVQEKIQAMALVHQKLYESQKLSSIDLKEYIDDLTAYLLKSYQVQPDRIALELDTGSVIVLIDTAIPCGLVLSELIANAFKHAFPGDRAGRVNIQLHRAEDESIWLQVSDNGVGVPEDFDFRQSESLGLQTVFGLVEHQLHGEVSVEKDQGVAWQIRFRDSLYDPRV